jgi:hypothetical protein
VDAYWIKMLLLAILAGMFVLTVWITPRIFISRPRTPDSPDPALDPARHPGDA